MVVLSTISAIASRTLRITRRTGQLSSSPQSEQRRYPVRLAQGNGASGPSRIRMTSPTVICEAGFAKA
jgi:hypothetical protein